MPEAPIRISASQPAQAQPLRVPVDLETVLKCRVPTIRHLPGAVQREFTALLTSTLDAYCADPSDSTLFGLLSLPKLVLRAVPLKGKNVREQLESMLRSRMSAFKAGNWQSLWEDLSKDLGGNLFGSKPDTRATKRARMASDVPSEATMRLAARHVAEGAPRKGLDVLLSHGTHDPEHPDVVQRLKDLHPQEEPVHLPLYPTSVEAPLQGEEALDAWLPIVRDCVLHFPRGSSPGPSGLRPWTPGPMA